MKRHIFTLIIALLILCPALFGQDVPTASGSEQLTADIVSYVQLDIMIAQNSFLKPTGLQSMQVYSQSLSPFYKSFLYERYSKDIVSAITLNLLTGGMGSWGMGDRLSGAILEVAMVGSYAFSLLAYINSVNGSESSAYIASALVSSGVVVVGGVLMPILRGVSWNSKLKKSLSM